MRVLLVAIVGLLVGIAAETASAVELRDAELVAGGSPVLQNGGGTVRLEQAQVNATNRPTFFVPEPGTALLVGFGAASLGVLRRHQLLHTLPSVSPPTRGPTA